MTQYRRPPAPGFGSLLAELRIARRVSQTTLAERAGLDHSYVSRLECGTRRPSYEAVIGLSQALELSAAKTDRLLIAAHFPPASRPMQALLAAVWAGSWPEALAALSACMNERNAA